MRRRTITRFELDVRVLAGVAIGLAIGALAVLVLFLAPSRLAYHHKPRHHAKHRTLRRAPSRMLTRTTTTILPAQTGADWGAPEPAGTPSPAPSFVDPTGYYTFDCGTDVSVGATLNFCHDGQVAGVYIDDTTPNIATSIAAATAKYSFVVVGQAPDGPCAAAGNPQVLCAREWYPYDCRAAPGAWGPIPPAQAYIGQALYAWPGCGPPTPAERQQLLADLEALHPRLLLLY